MAPGTTSTAALLNAEQGLGLLLNDDLPGARAQLEAQKDSPYALAGMGICEFLTAAVGLEDERLAKAMESLAAAEKAAKKGKASSEHEPGQWWTQPGLELEVLVADVVAAQSLLHLLGDSYVEYAKAMWKLNSTWKLFSHIYKTIFPNDIKPDATVASMVAELNDKFRTATVSHNLQAQHKGALGKLKSLSLGSRHGSTSDLHSTSTNGAPVNGAASMPVSVGGSTNASITGSPPNMDLQDMQLPAWTSSPVISFTISGGAFGHGLFELVFALMPPKARKMFSWLGYGAGDRKKGLKLLEMTARTGTDIHASFAALVLISYYCLVLLMSGWQCDRANLLESCSFAVENELRKHPQGTLWRLNKAKLLRYSGQVDEAMQLLNSAMEAPSLFRQAVSTLRFEMCWLLLSKCQYAEASASFMKMKELNSWSHSTYYAFAAGCLNELSSRTDAQEAAMAEYYAAIPGSFNRKRFMGQPPSSEIYLEKRIKFYKAKTDRWIAEGELKSGSEWWESIRISVAMELSLYWNQFTHYPKDSLITLTSRLDALLHADLAELDTPEEIALCHAILGACFVALPDFAKARTHLEAAEAAIPNLGEAYTYLGALSKLYLAILECKEADAASNAKGSKEVWRRKFAKAEAKLDEVFALTGYDMNGRVESRGQMLRVEIAEKKARLGL